MQENEKALTIVKENKIDNIKKILIDVYDEAIYRLETKRQKLDYEKYKLENLNDFIKENPVFEHYVSKMMLYKSKIKDLNEEIMKINSNNSEEIESIQRIYDINEIEIPKLFSKIQLHRKPFERIIEREKIDIEEKDIDEIVYKKIKFDDDNEINVNKTINSNIISNKILNDENNECLYGLKNKIQLMKNIKWYHIFRKIHMINEYNTLQKNIKNKKVNK